MYRMVGGLDRSTGGLWWDIYYKRRWIARYQTEEASDIAKEIVCTISIFEHRIDLVG